MMPRTTKFPSDLMETQALSFARTTSSNGLPAGGFPLPVEVCDAVEGGAIADFGDPEVWPGVGDAPPAAGLTARDEGDLGVLPFAIAPPPSKEAGPESAGKVAAACSCRSWR